MLAANAFTSRFFRRTSLSHGGADDQLVSLRHTGGTDACVRPCIDNQAVDIA